ncbi:TIR domain-containing protein [Ferrovibrio sp.]|uniref:TIR domain-containing protein n=1 Tax=Ferrovibrio sp. TaxID=1917215 RepID=UPI00311E5667
MDNRIRKNDVCIIGQPRCDYVFSSTRACFIAYGFADSTLEMEVLRGLLESRGIETYEAGSNIAAGQQAFCVKICSKIITSQFCIVLLNHSQKNNAEVPNANVNMEYGLMLGFNKHVIPFQREEQNLPFNVAGLDTIKYNTRNFRSLASRAIDLAISVTEQKAPQTLDFDQQLAVFLLANDCLVNPISQQGDKDIFELGRPMGYNLINDFGGFAYRYFGNFTSLNSSEICWRIDKLLKVIKARFGGMEERVRLGIATPQQLAVGQKLLEALEVWALVTGDNEKALIEEWLRKSPPSIPTRIFTIKDIERVSEERSVLHPSTI